ncbi:MAG: bifunctional heptose 7-phosphate kinase/heptose 1-phosphate adenyltransferase [Micavibrio aeruginosavorus]|uniref:Bifunctional protein HldE n=1 Tax=Micavibrio aeruginosavorus TaxID=349221 RepID=A0A7T5R4F9_9BACT|nr:MAG: bifunctional heptose 7-phosphate kinase/heptose 1-phosphate adenyltransferase [Micavibrio aeruginosavorus]
MNVPPSLDRACVLVIGDLMLDHYVYGEVRRLAPEGPVPVLAVTREDFILGGAGSVVANLAGLGVKTRLLGVVAADDAGARVRAALKSQGVDDAFLIEADDRPTIVKRRFVTGEQMLLRADYERVAALDAVTEGDLLKRIPAVLKGCGAVVISDYGKGMLTASVLASVMEASRQEGVPVLVDPKGTDFSIYRGATLITPNAQELSAATRLPTNTDEDIIGAAQILRQTTGIGVVVAKRSEKGMSVISDQPPLHFRTATRRVAGVAGAGDTVIATLAALLAEGAPLPVAAELANRAAGLVVQKPGTTPITQDEWHSLVADDEIITDTIRAAPVYRDWADARYRIDLWKGQGLKVGFTNGCFDILHYGHVNYLNRARERCDRLVVGLNADSSIARLKGAGRPVHEELSRAAVMAALGAVDMVVIFGDDRADDDKPIRLIEALRPDICFKGGDYRVEDLPEAKVILGYGGEVEIMPLYEGHSTTAAIRKMQKTG